MCGVLVNFLMSRLLQNCKAPIENFLATVLGCRAFALLLQLWYGTICLMWVWCSKTNRTSFNVQSIDTPWTARANNFGCWDNWMAVQHFPRTL